MVSGLLLVEVAREWNVIPVHGCSVIFLKAASLVAFSSMVGDILDRSLAAFSRVTRLNSGTRRLPYGI